jgi:hypothetical protein
MTAAVTQPPPPRRTLFAIGADLLALDALLDECGGDVSDPKVEAAVEAWHAELAADEAAKLDGWVGWVEPLEREAKAARAEAAEFAARAQARERAAAAAKARMLDHLLATGRTKAVTASGRTISAQQNGGLPPVVIDPDADPATAADRLCQVHRRIDPASVRLALQAGETLPFARLGERGFQLRIRS